MIAPQVIKAADLSNEAIELENNSNFVFG